jgi:hypothetical protein
LLRPGEEPPTLAVTGVVQDVQIARPGGSEGKSDFIPRLEDPLGVYTPPAIVLPEFQRDFNRGFGLAGRRIFG